ncbi:MAG: hypothetical protein ABJH06_00910 [Paraglaciecola sp.]|uniref:hypothetical protein n=1 Tax=Paraglaciecola sp. TaxID=1920173 RepID=UPI0032648C1D
MSSNVRLALSAVISFVFYFTWSYWANSLVTENMSILIRSAFVQGSLSATITILFTFILEKTVGRFNQSYISLVFVVPIICSVYSKTKQNIAIFKTFQNALSKSATYLSHNPLPGTIFAPLLPITVQAFIAIAVNTVNQTPNLWLTVAPSILITAIYGYVYTFTLLITKPVQPVSED